MYQADLYARSNNCTRDSTKKILKKYCYLLNWKKNETILELGIGDGRTSSDAVFPILPQDFREYIGSDRASSMVEHARKVIESERAQFAVLDISKQIPIEFQDRFNHIFSFYMLHWIKEPM